MFQKLRDSAALLAALGAIAAFAGQWWDMRHRVQNVELAIRAQMSEVAMEQRFMTIEYAIKDLTRRVENP